MAERILCDDGVRVSVSGAGERVLVAVKGPSTIRFWADASDLKGALNDGSSMQLSVHGGYCRIEVRESRVHLEFAVEGSGRKNCDFPVRDLEDALDMVRRQHSQDLADAEVHVEEA